METEFIFPEISETYSKDDSRLKRIIETVNIQQRWNSTQWLFNLISNAVLLGPVLILSEIFLIH